MAASFPNSPVNGDTTVINGITYTYDSTNNKWSAASVSGSGGSGTTVYATLAELPLTNVTNGAQAFVSETDRLYIWADNGWYNIALINTSPTITQGGAGSYELATDGTPTVITLTATDPEGIPITWSYSVTSGSLSNGGGTTATVSQADNVFTITPTTTDTYAGTFELTFTASDGVNLATDTNSFSLVFVTLVQNSRYTTALITTDGTTGTNTTFTDSSSNALTITSAGTPSSQSFSPYRSGGYSVEIDASAGNWIQAQSHSDFAFGTGDFTVEFWMKSQKSDQWLLLIDQQYQAQGVSIWINPTNELIYYPNSSTPALTSQALTMSDWIHVALVRNSGTTKFYVNGVWNSTSYSDSQNFPTNLPLKIGSDYSAASYGYKGYFRDVRVTNTAVYSTNFTPPTEPLTEIAGTRLLTCQSLTFKDESTTPHTIGITGTPSIVPVGPYDYDEYNPSNHGGSVYLDGTGDYLAVTHNGNFNFGTGDFTIDFWYYPTAHKNWSELFDTRNSEYTAGAMAIYTNASGTLYVYSSNGTTGSNNITGDNLVLNQWSHIEVSRSSGSTKLFINGKQSGSTYTDGNNYTGPATTPRIGTDQSAQYSATGYISDFRILNGTAAHTTDFTPPTAPLSSSGAAFHLVGIGAPIIDKSQSTTFVINNGYADDGSYGGVGPKYAGSSFYNTNNNPNGGISFTLPEGLGTDDFTIEGWLKWMTNGSWDGCFFQIGDHTQSSGLILNLHNPNPVIRFGSSNTYVDNTTTIASNQWYHIAVTRESGVCKIWLDGQLEGTRTTPEDITATTGYILSANYNNSGIVGHVEDFRITKGLARYTANFTPPTGSLEG